MDMEDQRQQQGQNPVPNLTPWSNEPTIDDLKGDLEEAQSHHSAHVEQVGEWLDYLHVQGVAKQEKVKGRSSVTPKLIRKQAEWRYSSLTEAFLSQENLFSTQPQSWEDRAAAEQNGLILNNQFNTKLDKVNFIDEYVRTAVDEGSVVVRVGWDFQEKEVEVPNIVPEPVEGVQAQMILAAIEQVMQNPEAAAQIPQEFMQDIQASMEARRPVTLVERGTKKEMQTIVNQPTLNICEHSTIIIDPSCKGVMAKAGFIIYQFETSLSDLEKSSVEYKNLDKIDVEKSAIHNASQISTGEEEEGTSSFNFRDKARRKFHAYEYWGYWDIDDSGVTTPFVGTWVGDTMIRMEESPFPDQGLPFVLAQYLPKRKAVYGEPDGALLQDNQDVSGAVTRGMLDIMGRSAVGQRGTRKDALDVTNQRRFDSGQNYSYNPGVDPRTAFYDHTYPDLPQSAPFMLQLQQQEAEALSGVKAYNTGITGESLGKVASAAREAVDAAGKRELGILRRLGNGIIEIGRKITAMNAIFLEDEEVVRITNEEFVTVKRDDLAGKLDMKMEISTAEADNAKAQELAFMLQTIGPNADPAEVRMIRAEIAKLRKMPDLAKRIEEYQPQPDPHMIQMQQLEIQEKIATIRKLNSEALENEQEAGLDAAKTRNEHAKADQADLDFVEQESGVKQERDLQKQGEQARANQDLERTKALLNNQGNPDGGTAF